MAAGSRQSPVNIETDRVESDHEALSSKPLRWKYPATASRKLVNPGYCWRIDTDGDGTRKLSFRIPLSNSPPADYDYWDIFLKAMPKLTLVSLKVIYIFKSRFARRSQISRAPPPSRFAFSSICNSMLSIAIAFWRLHRET